MAVVLVVVLLCVLVVVCVLLCCCCVVFVVVLLLLCGSVLLWDWTPLDRPPLDRPPLDRPLSDRPPPDRPPPDRPPSDRSKFRSFSSLSLFLCLSGCLLVEFWWCFWRPEPLNVHVWVLGLSCETPAAPPDRAAWARTRQPENSKRALRRIKTPPKFHEKTPRETQWERNGGGKGKKKREILGPPPFGAPPFGASLFLGLGPPPFEAPPFEAGLAKVGQLKLAKVGQIFLAKVELAKVGLSHSSWVLIRSSSCNRLHSFFAWAKSSRYWVFTEVLLHIVGIQCWDLNSFSFSTRMCFSKAILSRYIMPESCSFQEDDVTEKPVTYKTVTGKLVASSNSESSGNPDAEARKLPHDLHMSPAVIPHMDTVFSIARKIYDRESTDNMEDLGLWIPLFEQFIFTKTLRGIYDLSRINSGSLWNSH